jgi:dimethylhistidine N-methyltransferase
MSATHNTATPVDPAHVQAIFCQEVLQGLQKPRKELPSKYFYDETGSHLFDLICELDEYYITRTELKIMQAFLHDIVDVLGPQCMLVEYGSGSSTKTRMLLNALPDLAAYVPIDISKNHLQGTVTTLAKTYPTLDIVPVCTDYTRPFTLPIPTKPVKRRVAYYPGSTIGNFDPEAACHFLHNIASTFPGGGLLIGVDLKKDCTLLHKAYNDRSGVTAQFNLHLLERINQELYANFQLDQFTHYAFYNPTLGRIEMHLVCGKSQHISIGNTVIPIKQAESIWTESSYKYTLEEFAQLATRAGLKVEQVWLDEDALFSIQYLSVTSQRNQGHEHRGVSIGSD